MVLFWQLTERKFLTFFEPLDVIISGETNQFSLSGYNWFLGNKEHFGKLIPLHPGNWQQFYLSFDKPYSTSSNAPLLVRVVEVNKDSHLVLYSCTEKQGMLFKYVEEYAWLLSRRPLIDPWTLSHLERRLSGLTNLEPWQFWRSWKKTCRQSQDFEKEFGSILRKQDKLE